MKNVDALRKVSRKLVRELGIIQLDRTLAGPTAQYCHALVEIGSSEGITVSELAERLILSVSAASRLVANMKEQAMVEYIDSVDKREKALRLTAHGENEMQNVDEYSSKKVQGAFEYLSDKDQEDIVKAMQKYAHALEQSRKDEASVKIRTLSTSRVLRRQIVAMVKGIQEEEYQKPIPDEINVSILRAEEHFYYNHSSNFWYAVDSKGKVIGCIGLKKIDSKNAELKKLFVDKKYRGKGVAQKLLQTLTRAALKHGFTKIWLGTVADFQSAHAFYEKSGFTKVKKSTLPKGFEICHLDGVFFAANTTTLQQK